MHVKARTVAVSGLMLALTILFMVLGSVIETNTLFLLAAASFFVGIIIREFGMKAGVAFYLAAVLLGFFLAPNKLYVGTFAAMGFYILGREALWAVLTRKGPEKNRMALFWIGKYVLFNEIYIPGLILLREVILPQTSSGAGLLAAAAAGQIVLLVYDKSYSYVQVNVWGKICERLKKF